MNVMLRSCASDVEAAAREEALSEAQNAVEVGASLGEVVQLQKAIHENVRYVMKKTTIAMWLLTTQNWKGWSRLK